MGGKRDREKRGREREEREERQERERERIQFKNMFFYRQDVAVLPSKINKSKWLKITVKTK